MDLQLQQQQWDEKRADKEHEASHLCQDQAMFNGHKVSLLTLFS
jgi:hypothetical protein